MKNKKIRILNKEKTSEEPNWCQWQRKATTKLVCTAQRLNTMLNQADDTVQTDSLETVSKV